MSDPVTDVRFRTGEEVVDTDYIMAHEHKAIYKVGTDEACALHSC